MGRRGRQRGNTPRKPAVLVVASDEREALRSWALEELDGLGPLVAEAARRVRAGSEDTRDREAVYRATTAVRWLGAIFAHLDHEPPPAGQEVRIPIQRLALRELLTALQREATAALLQRLAERELAKLPPEA